jgi:hypothetical protein
MKVRNVILLAIVALAAEASLVVTTAQCKPKKGVHSVLSIASVHMRPTALWANGYVDINRSTRRH